MRQKQVLADHICTGAHFLHRGNFSVLGNEEMSPVHFVAPPFPALRISPPSCFCYPAYTTEPPVEQFIIKSEEAQELQNAINGFPWFLREVTYLHYYKSLSIHEIARLMHKPAPIVKTWLAHSIYWLKIFVLKFKPPE